MLHLVGGDFVIITHEAELVYEAHDRCFVPLILACLSDGTEKSQVLLALLLSGEQLRATCDEHFGSPSTLIRTAVSVQVILQEKNLAQEIRSQFIICVQEKDHLNLGTILVDRPQTHAPSLQR